MGAFSWGTYWGLGHLDLVDSDQTAGGPLLLLLGGLDHPRPSWEKIRPLDEGFPLYYEDLEWCYRAG